MCRLTCASLTEDRYGVVQRDIPKIIEALLSFLTALEEYQTELNASYALPPPDQLQQLSPKELAKKETLAMEAARAGEVLSVVSDGAFYLVVPTDMVADEYITGPQRSRTVSCRSYGRLATSCPRSNSRRVSRGSFRGSLITTKSRSEA